MMVSDCVLHWIHISPAPEFVIHLSEFLKEEVYLSSDMDRSDCEIAEEIHQRPELFLLLYERYYDRILNFLYRRTLKREVAEDLTSQTFLKAFEYLKASSRKINFKPWLYRVATNLQISEGRKIKTLIGKIPEMIWCHNHKQSGQNKLPEDDLREKLDSLPDKYRLVIMLRYYEELSFEEIAESMGIKEASVRSRVSRGLKMLEKKMKKERV